MTKAATTMNYKRFEKGLTRLLRKNREIPLLALKLEYLSRFL